MSLDSLWPRKDTVSRNHWSEETAVVSRRPELEIVAYQESAYQLAEDVTFSDVPSS